ncbi:MAG: C-GCAxxG-C-C family protein [Peptococcaceae bacterium]|nr:C-GCAxxG-C-C family protein [Peptococcaceae bacterium]
MTIEEQVKALKKDRDYCCTQITYQLAGLDPLGLSDDVGQKALRALGWGVRTQRTCGAITGGAMALALYIDDKDTMIKAVQSYTNWFKDTFHHTDCGDLLGWGKQPDGRCHNDIVAPCVHKLLEITESYRR